MISSIKIWSGVLLILLTHQFGADSKSIRRRVRIVSLDLEEFQSKPYIKRVEAALASWIKKSERCTGDLEILYKNKCHTLVDTEQSPAACPAKEWLVLKKPQNETGRYLQIEPVCAEVKCAYPSVWWPSLRKCIDYAEMEKEGVCGKNSVLVIDPFGDGYCDCAETQGQLKERGDCYNLYQQGPCEDTEVLVYDPVTSLGKCTADLCLKENSEYSRKKRALKKRKVEVTSTTEEAVKNDSSEQERESKVVEHEEIDVDERRKASALKLKENAEKKAKETEEEIRFADTKVREAEEERRREELDRREAELINRAEELERRAADLRAREVEDKRREAELKVREITAIKKLESEELSRRNAELERRNEEQKRRDAELVSRAAEEKRREAELRVRETVAKKNKEIEDRLRLADEAARSKEAKLREEEMQQRLAELQQREIEFRTRIIEEEARAKEREAEIIRKSQEAKILLGDLEDTVDEAVKKYAPLNGTGKCMELETFEGCVQNKNSNDTNVFVVDFETNLPKCIALSTIPQE